MSVFGEGIQLAETLIVLAILIAELKSLKQETERLKLEKDNNVMYATFFNERREWYARRGRPKRARPDLPEQLVRPGVSREADSLGRDIQPESSNGGIALVIARDEITAEESEERVDGASESERPGALRVEEGSGREPEGSEGAGVRERGSDEPGGVV